MQIKARKQFHSTGLEPLEGRVLLSGYTAKDVGLWTAGSLNESGVVAGGQYPGPTAAFRDAAGVVRNIKMLSGSYASYSTDVDESGQLVGYALGEGMNTDQHRAFLWHSGKVSELLRPANGRSDAFGMNDKGAVVGAVRAVGKSSQAVVWQYKQMQTLGTLGGPSSVAYGMNNLGQVVGESQLPGGGLPHPFLYSGGKMTDLGVLYGGGAAIAQAINDAGQVVGGSYITGFKMRAVLWAGVRTTSLGTLANHNWSQALDINKSGAVVGFSSFNADDQRAFVWTAAGRMVDLNSFFPGANFKLTQGVSINDKGQIAAVGKTTDGGQHVYLLSPQTTTTARAATPATAQPPRPAAAAASRSRATSIVRDDVATNVLG